MNLTPEQKVRLDIDAALVAAGGILRTATRSTSAPGLEWPCARPKWPVAMASRTTCCS